jgi:hypothetical protein
MKIGFLRQEPGTKHAPYDLWTMAADGSGQVKLARNVSLAAWSSDAAMIAFIRGGRPGEYFPKPKGLWVMQPDGSGQVLIAKDARDFDWQPLP